MKCLGITKKYVRCKRNCKTYYCYQHRIRKTFLPQITKDLVVHENYDWINLNCY